MRSKGGFTELLRQAIERVMAPLLANPRVAPMIADLATDLEREIPTMRRQLQGIVTRLTMPTALGTVGKSNAAPTRAAIGLGVHPEIRVEDNTLPMMGAVDLIAIAPGRVTIIDFKTGERKDAHLEQLRTYAHLWYRDIQMNPDGLHATELIASYPDGSVVIQGPSEAELRTLASVLERRVQASNTAITHPDPEARPSPENCRYCSVRHLCDAYWSTGTNMYSDTYVDVDLQIERQRGERSWDATHLSADGGPAPAILRTTKIGLRFRPLQRVRLLDVAVAKDPESPLAVYNQTRFTEIFSHPPEDHGEVAPSRREPLDG